MIRSATAMAALLMLIQLPAARADFLRLEVSAMALDPYDDAYDRALDAGFVPQSLLLAIVPIAWGLSIEAGYVFLDADGGRGNYSTELHTDGGVLGLRAELPLESWLAIHARVDALLVHGALGVDFSGPLALESTDVSPGVAGAIGAEVHLPRSLFWGSDSSHPLRGFTLGFIADVGYQWLAPFDFDTATPTGLDGAGAGQSQPGVALGSLSLSSLTTRLGFVVHF